MRPTSLERIEWICHHLKLSSLNLLGRITFFSKMSPRFFIFLPLFYCDPYEDRRAKSGIKYLSYYNFGLLMSIRLSEYWSTSAWFSFGFHTLGGEGRGPQSRPRMPALVLSSSSSFLLLRLISFLPSFRSSFHIIIHPSLFASRVPPWSWEALQGMVLFRSSSPYLLSSYSPPLASSLLLIFTTLTMLFIVMIVL